MSNASQSAVTSLALLVECAVTHVVKDVILGLSQLALQCRRESVGLQQAPVLERADRFFQPGPLTLHIQLAPVCRAREHDKDAQRRLDLEGQGALR